MSGRQKRRRRRPARQTRRYGSRMSRRDKLLLALLWVAVQVAAFFVFDEWSQRVGTALLTLFALPLVVTLWMSPRSSR